MRELLRQPNSTLLLGDGTWLPGARALLLHDPSHVISGQDPTRVPKLLEDAEAELRQGRFVVLCLSYEAAAAFDLATHPPTDIAPVGWFASYPPENVLPVDLNDLWPLAMPPNLDDTRVSLSVTETEYTTAIAAIKDLIAAGDTYQVNYTCHARFALAHDPLGYFLALARSHPVPYAAYVNTGDTQIVSLSPELLVQRWGELLESRPMKGTRGRGRTLEEDRLLATELAASEKDRAENVMILDMVRNDLGRVCRAGSVTVPQMFSVEKYRSVWQMTSTAIGEALPSLTIADVMAAFFPGSSVTGAPKHRTMEIIRDLEREPRGLYTGTIGLFSPTGDFTCNLPIRTLVRRDGQWDLGIGSGIVWDSDPKAEYEETLLKSQFAFSIQPNLRLFETMLVRELGEVAFEAEHIERLGESAEYWDFPLDRKGVQSELGRFVISMDNLPAVLRMELDQDGLLHFAVRQAPEAPADPVKVVLSATRTNSQDRFLFHKTNRRKVYQDEFERAHEYGFFEVIFQNQHNRLTEGAITSLFIRKGDKWLTSPLGDGLLPGVWRQSFIKTVNAEERSLSVEDLAAADAVVIGNSVRGAIPVGEVWEGFDEQGEKFRLLFQDQQQARSSIPSV